MDPLHCSVSDRVDFFEVEVKNQQAGGFPIRTLKADLSGKRVSILGLGKSGISAAKCLKKLGAELFLSESLSYSKIKDSLPESFRKMKKEFGGHTEKCLDSDLIIVSPGVHWDLPVLVRARKKGVSVWSELELGIRSRDFGELIAITGTNGKTTVVSLIGDMCGRGGRKTLVAGNIGSPLCDFVSSREDYDLTVLEASSYQLEGVETFHPKISAILNLTNDHLQRHKTMSGYAKAKERIFLNQGPSDVAVFNSEDSWCRKIAEHCKAGLLWFGPVPKKNGEGVFYDLQKRKLIAIMPAQQKTNPLELPFPACLPGIHNLENACAATACALSAGIAPSAIVSSLMKFKGVEHRLEKVKTIRGVTYINDSKATNVSSAVKALESCGQPLWLILGGQDKGGSYQPLKSLILHRERDGAGPVKGVFLIGEASSKIKSKLKGSSELIVSGTLEKAVKDASERASSGDVVLLSPACASFDQFMNYEDRGRQFKRFVGELK